MTDGIDDATPDEGLTPQEEAILRGKEAAWLTDYGYLAGEGTPYANDNQHLLHLGWRDSSNNYDRVMSMEMIQRRYHSKLVFFAVTREAKFSVQQQFRTTEGGIQRPLYVSSEWYVWEYKKTDGPTHDEKGWPLKRESRRVPAQATDQGAFREPSTTLDIQKADRDRDGTPIVATGSVFMGWKYNFQPVGDADIRAEDSKVYARVQRIWNNTGKLPSVLQTGEEKTIKNDLLQLLKDLKELTGEDWSTKGNPNEANRRVIMERRWILGRNHPETYQQHLRVLGGKIPEEYFFAEYNELRRQKARNMDRPLEEQDRVRDPYSASLKHLLDKRVDGRIVYAGTPEYDEARGRLIPEIRITLLNDHGLSTLAEYNITQKYLINGYTFERTWEWQQNMRAKALQRASLRVKLPKSHPLHLSPNAVGDFVDDYPEGRTFWITPSCSDAFVRSLANQIRTDYREELPEGVEFTRDEGGREVMRRLPSLRNQGGEEEKQFSDELNADILTATSITTLADKKCRNVNAFAHIVKSCRITRDGQADFTEAKEVRLTIEEDRDKQRRNEDQVQTRTLTMAYDAGQLDQNRPGQARDRGIGGPRSAEPWIADPKFRLNWCLLYKQRRDPRTGKILRNDLGNPLWEPRYSSEDGARASVMIQRALANPATDVVVPTQEEAVKKAWKKRCDENLFVAQFVQDPYYDRRPADTAIATNLIGRKTSITGGVKLNITGATKAANGKGYTFDDLLKDLPGLRNYLPNDYDQNGAFDGKLDEEFYILQLELMFYIDPRYVAKIHKGSWSWYLFHEQNMRVTRISEDLRATRANFLRQQDVAWGMWAGQSPKGMVLHCDETLSTDIHNGIFNPLPDLQKAANGYPGIHMPNVIMVAPDGQKWNLQDRPRKDFEDAYTPLNWRAHEHIGRGEADDTFIGYATAFSTSTFTGLAHSGLGRRLGDTEAETYLVRAQGRQSWVNGVVPALKSHAEAVSAFGTGDLNENDWMRSALDSGKVTGEWFKSTGQLFWKGEKVQEVKILHTAEYIKDHSYPDNPRDAHELAKMIWERRIDGKGYRYGWEEVEAEAIRILFGGQRPAQLNPHGRWRLNAIYWAYRTTRHFRAVSLTSEEERSHERPVIHLAAA
ncbi:MAG: hypothetical protein Q8P13_00465 [bacterium]|nr:hypothetical protein [bacterium]